jgi:hypothetical protein
MMAPSPQCVERSEATMTNRFAVALLLVLAVAPRAFATTLPQPPVFQDANGLAPSAFALNAEFLGNSGICRIESSTPTLVAVSCPGTTGQSGIVYEVTNSSGTAGDSVAVLDVALASLPANSVVGFDVNGLKIAPNVLSAGGSATGCTTQAVCEDWRPMRPSRFTNGLGGQRKGTSNALLFYRLDSHDAVTPPTK